MLETRHVDRNETPPTTPPLFLILLKNELDPVYYCQLTYKTAKFAPAMLSLQWWNTRN